MQTLFFIVAMLGMGYAYAQTEPPVKMSSSGVCHAKGSSYYAQTKKFTAFETMEGCLKAGGRRSKK
jgi:hypothetical protein